MRGPVLKRVSVVSVWCFVFVSLCLLTRCEGLFREASEDSRGRLKDTGGGLSELQVPSCVLFGASEPFAAFGPSLESLDPWSGTVECAPGREMCRWASCLSRTFGAGFVF